MAHYLTVHRRRTKSLFTALLLSVIFCSISSGVVLAANVSETYKAEGIAPGTLVSLRSGSSDEIEPTSDSNLSGVVGVVVDAASTVVELDMGKGDALVVRSGEVAALVTDNGSPVVEGDTLTLSRISGVLTSSRGATDTLLGVALESGTDVTDRSTITLQDGKSVEVYPMRVSLSESLAEGKGQASKLREFISEIAGREVPLVRIIAALLIFVTSLTYGSILLITGVRTSIIAVGRNPLANRAIFLALLKTVAISFSIMTLGVLGSYGVISF